MNSPFHSHMSTSTLYRTFSISFQPTMPSKKERRGKSKIAVSITINFRYKRRQGGEREAREERKTEKGLHMRVKNKLQRFFTYFMENREKHADFESEAFTHTIKMYESWIAKGRRREKGKLLKIVFRSTHNTFLLPMHLLLIRLLFIDIIFTWSILELLHYWI